jgi:hypothetical protein
MFLQKFVRRPGPESDNHILTPMSYHASTSPLIRMLDKGHKGVKLTANEWSVLYTWIDLNAPFHGSMFPMSGGRMNTHWKVHEVPFVKMPHPVDVLGLTWDMKGIKDLYAYRMKMMGKFSPVVHDPEAEYAAREKIVAAMEIDFEMPEGEDEPADRPKLAGWPFDGAQAAKLRDDWARKLSIPATRKLKAGELTIDMVLIPAGKYVSQISVVSVDKPFYISAREISLGEFKQFDPKHDNRFVDRNGKDHRNRGHSLQNPALPAIRVSWDRADAFCKWIAKTNNVGAALPTDAQWEWAARAGSGQAFWFGDVSSDYAKTANFADKSMGRGFTPCQLDSHSDGTATLAPTTANKPNAWGLVNAFGNAAEWTSSVCPKEKTHRIVRGGSFIDLPKHSTADVKMHYAHYQPLVNVGFRIATPTP